MSQNFEHTKSLVSLVSTQRKLAFSLTLKLAWFSYISRSSSNRMYQLLTGLSTATMNHFKWCWFSILRNRQILSGFGVLLGEGFVDTFRHFYPDQVSLSVIKDDFSWPVFFLRLFLLRWEPLKLCFWSVMSQQYETEIPWLWIQNMGLTKGSIYSLIKAYLHVGPILHSACRLTKPTIVNKLSLSKKN